jgi:hypothetical protein
MHVGALPDGRASAPEVSNTLLPRHLILIQVLSEADRERGLAVEGFPVALA